MECPCRESATANPLLRALYLQRFLYRDAGGAGMEPDGMAEKEPEGFTNPPGGAAKLLFFAVAQPIRHPALGVLRGYALARLPKHIPNRR